MTYCVAIATEQGLILASDSRTNAGPDQLSTFSKMHVLLDLKDITVFCKHDKLQILS